MKKLIKRAFAYFLGAPLFPLIPSHKIKNITPDEAVQNVTNHSPDMGRSAVCGYMWPQPEYDLTIIVPVYNVEKYLKKCVDSILNQKTEYNYQLIIVNDGSSDRSGEILEQYCSNRHITIIHQKNGGISKARNTGLKFVKGRYIMFVDSDDFLPENAVDALMRTAYEIDADVVQGSYSDVDEAGESNIGGRHYKKCVNVSPNGTLTGMAWGKVYKADLFKNVHFPENYWYEDTIVTAIITHLAKIIATIPDVVYYYRLNSFGITKISKGKPKSVDTYWVHRCVMRDRSKLGMVTDGAFYEHLLRMVALSYQRTENEPEDVKIALMILWKDLLEQERKEEFVLSTKYRHLDKSIRECDYTRYCVLCKFCF